MNTRRLLSGIVAVTCLLSLAACRSSGSGKASTTDTGAAPSTTASSAAASTAAAAGGDTPAAIVAAAAAAPSSIPSTLAKLPKAPAKGLKVAFLSCSDPSCALLNPGFSDAAKALGWKPTIITYNSAQPGQALQQAINAGYKYIATTSITLNTITPQIAQAKAKGIAIFGAYTGDKPEMKTNGLYGVSADFGTSAASGKLMAAWTINDSKSAANTVFVSLPIYPTLVAQGDAAKAEYASACPKCSFSTLGLSANQVGQGQTASAIVTYLKSHTSTNYVYLAFGGLDAGVAAAIKSAGLASKVKIVGTQGQKSEMQEVVNGSEAAWSILPEQYTMWVVVDWMARLNTGVLDQTALDATSSNPTYMVDTPAAATKQLGVDDGIWQGPTGFQDQFKALWGV
jgi:ABC-type sugar transport system substrate-binding protein